MGRRFTIGCVAAGEMPPLGRLRRGREYKMRNALMASRHPCYTGNGYLCDCGNFSQDIKAHRNHLLLSEHCRENNATVGDLKYIKKTYIHFGKSDSLCGCGSGVVLTDTPDLVTCYNCHSRLYSKNGIKIVVDSAIRKAEKIILICNREERDDLITSIENAVIEAESALNKKVPEWDRYRPKQNAA